jgi:hypothetical protein
MGGLSRLVSHGTASRPAAPRPAGTTRRRRDLSPAMPPGEFAAVKTFGRLASQSAARSALQPQAAVAYRGPHFRMCRYCCKTILGTWTSNFDSRTVTYAQHRFKNYFVRIRLLRASCPPGSFATISANSGPWPVAGKQTSDRSAWRDLVKFREGWIAGVATYQAEPYPRPVETRVERDGAWRNLRVGRKAYWAIEGARRERLRYRPATPSPGTRPKS